MSNNVVKVTVLKEKCQNCGACLEFSELFSEEKDGTISVKEEIYHEKEQERINEAVKQCPFDAIRVEKENMETDKQTIIEELKSLLSYKYPTPTYEDISYWDCKSTFESGYGSLASGYIYSSYDAAERAGVEALNRKVYQQLNNIGKKILNDYKAQVLCRILTYSPEEKNYAYRINGELSKKIYKLRIAAENVCAKSFDLPEDFHVIDISPSLSSADKKNNPALYAIGIIADTYLPSSMAEDVESPSWYSPWIKTSSTELPDGNDWRGNIKYREKFSYDICDAFCEMKKHYFDNVEPTIKEWIMGQVSSNLFMEIYKPIEKAVSEKAKVLLEELGLDAEQLKKIIDDISTHKSWFENRTTADDTVSDKNRGSSLWDIFKM